MALIYDRSSYNRMIGITSGGSRSSQALDTNFTLGSAGKCIGVRFIALSTTTIARVLFFITAADATGRNLSVNACAYGASSSRAGSALTNGTVNVAGGTTAGVWLKATYSTPPNVTQGEPYWVVIGDAAGAASGYSVMSRGTGSNAIPSSGYLLGFTSSDGFATNGSPLGSPVAIVIVFSDGNVIASTVGGAAVNHANNQYERGIKYTPDVDEVLVGVTSMGTSTPPSTAKLKVYPDGVNPGGTVFAGFNGGAELECNDNAALLTSIYFEPCVLQGGVTYRIVFDFVSNNTFPGYYSIEDYTHDETDLLAGGLPGVIHTIENAGGTWDDTPSFFPRLGLIFQKQVIEAASGGGGGLPIFGGGIMR